MSYAEGMGTGRGWRDAIGSDFVEAGWQHEKDMAYRSPWEINLPLVNTMVSGGIQGLNSTNLANIEGQTATNLENLRHRNDMASFDHQFDKTTAYDDARRESALGSIGNILGSMGISGGGGGGGYGIHLSANKGGGRNPLLSRLEFMGK